MTLAGNIGLALALTFGVSPAMSFGDSIPEGQMTVVVRHGPGVDAVILKRGLEEAARLYLRGGVAIEWREWAVGNDHRHLYLIVVRRDTVRSEAPNFALGTTPREPGKTGRISYVFLEPIEMLAAAHGVDASSLLGAAIAHELAHLLLPNRPHTQGGLMRALWGGAEAKAANRGMLRFLPSDFTAMLSPGSPFIATRLQELP